MGNHTNLSFGFIKNEVVRVFIEENPNEIIAQLKKLLLKNVVPIRPYRKNPRHIDKYRNKRKPNYLRNFKNAI